MGQRIFSNRNGDYETVVTIEPTSEIDCNMPDFDYCYPAAEVKVEFKHNGKLMHSTTFKKILDMTLYHDEGPGVVQIADDMINGNLSKIGLGGLSTLDIYYALRTMGVSTNLNADIMQEILENSLHIPYDDMIDHISHSFNYSKDCFYNLEVLVYKIR